MRHQMSNAASMVYGLGAKPRLTHQPIKLYSLYRLDGKRWVRARMSSFDLKTAERVFRNELLAMACGSVTRYCLRPIEIECMEAR